MSPWVRRWSHLVAPGATLLDVACGTGRHLRWFAARGCSVTGVDRDEAALHALNEVGELIVADLEAGPWPLGERRFDAVVVTNYLWRDRLPAVVASVADGGVLICETFAAGQQTLGKPSNPQFLLRAGELLQVAAGLRIVAYEDGFEAAAPRFVQRLVAVRATPGADPPRRYPLEPPSGMDGRLKSADSGDTA